MTPNFMTSNISSTQCADYCLSNSLSLIYIDALINKFSMNQSANNDESFKCYFIYFVFYIPNSL